MELPQNQQPAAWREGQELHISQVGKRLQYQSDLQKWDYSLQALTDLEAGWENPQNCDAEVEDDSPEK
jgi:hypothetical protein